VGGALTLFGGGGDTRSVGMRWLGR
jgi:hypothetical protein